MGKSGFSGGLPFEQGARPQPVRFKGPDEAFIRQRITQFLEQRNVVYAVTDAKTVQTSDGPRQLVWPEGWPDITAILPVTGQIWAIEVKTETGDLRESQHDMLTLIAASGGLVTIARDCVIIRQILNNHLAKYRPSELSIYIRVIDRLKRVYTEHARKRAAVAKFKRARRRG